MMFLRKRKKERIDKTKEKDSGELSQAMIIISGLAVAGITVTGTIAGASLIKGEESARCINNFNTFESGTTSNDCSTVASDNNGTLPPAGENENATPGEPIEKNHTSEDCFKTSTVPGGTAITKYLIAEKPEECGKFVIIPDELDGAPVVDIYYGAFSPTYYLGSGINEEHKINSVVIPSTVKTIKSNAFDRNNLTSVDIPYSVKRIEDNAFNRNKLTSVNISDSVEYIGNSAFSRNNLTSINIPDSVGYIGTGAFKFNQLTYVKIPDSITTIEDYVFYYNNLTSVNIPDSVEHIGKYAFYNNKLTSVTVPKSVESIGGSAFGSNANLKEIKIPTGIETSPNAIPHSTKVTYY